MRRLAFSSMSTTFSAESLPRTFPRKREVDRDPVHQGLCPFREIRLREAHAQLTARLPQPLQRYPVVRHILRRVAFREELETPVIVLALYPAHLPGYIPEDQLRGPVAPPIEELHPLPFAQETCRHKRVRDQRAVPSTLPRPPPGPPARRSHRGLRASASPPRSPPSRAAR